MNQKCRKEEYRKQDISAPKKEKQYKGGIFNRTKENRHREDTQKQINTRKHKRGTYSRIKEKKKKNDIRKSELKAERTLNIAGSITKNIKKK